MIALTRITALREIVETTIRNHPSDCVFTPNAVENILEKARNADVSTFAKDDTLLDFLEDAIKAEEIYCPHEGIDNRAEYYSRVNVAGWTSWSQHAHEMI